MNFIDFVLHIDQHLIEIVNHFGNWTYLILFLIVFIETGLVVFPFLPGDSLIFAAAAMTANQAYQLNFWFCWLVFAAAAVFGDTANYEIGSRSLTIGKKHAGFNRLIDERKRLAAQKFFERHGGKTIIIGRFIPFIRTFVPFVSGASKMHYGTFIVYNLLGGIAWVSLFASLGFFFGNIPLVKSHFSLVVVAIVIVSVLPVLIIWLKKKIALKKEFH